MLLLPLVAEVVVLDDLLVELLRVADVVGRVEDEVGRTEVDVVGRVVDGRTDDDELELVPLLLVLTTPLPLRLYEDEPLDDDADDDEIEDGETYLLAEERDVVAIEPLEVTLDEDTPGVYLLE